MKIVLIVSPTMKIRDELQQRLPHFMCAQVSGFDAINDTVKKDDVIGAVVIELTEVDDWITFEHLKTGYGEVPRFGILSIEDDDSLNIVKIQDEYKAAGIFLSPLKQQHFDQLANMITRLSGQDSSDETASGVEKALDTQINQIGRELGRLNADFNKFQIGVKDAGEGLNWKMVEKLQSIRQELQKINFQEEILPEDQ